MQKNKEGNLIGYLTCMAVICLVLFFSSFAYSATPAQISKIYAWGETKPEGFHETIMWQNGNVSLVTLAVKRVVETSYATKEEHLLNIITWRKDNKFFAFAAIWVDNSIVQELLCPDISQTTHWNIGSIKDGGRADRVIRNFWLFHPSSGIIFPNFPEGFVNERWTNPTNEESQKAFDEEINFWVGEIDSCKHDR